jgi:hypothetical protein
LAEEGKAYDLKHKLLEYFERKKKQVPIVHGSLHSKSSIDPIPDVVYQEDPVYIRDASGNIINPSTEETLAGILAKLDVALSSRASESSLVSALSRKLVNTSGTVVNPATEDTLTNVLNKLADILAKLDVNLSTRASESSLVSALPRNITQWGNTPLTGRDISLDLSYIGGHRFKHYYSISGNVTVPANSSVNWLSVSGTGRLLYQYYVGSVGIPASQAYQIDILDNVESRIIRMPDVWLASYWGFTTVGNYSLGSRAFRIHIWDTTNNNYDVRHFAEPYPACFRNSMVQQFYNTNTTTDATMGEHVEYEVFTASKVVYAKMQSQSDIHDAGFIRKKLVKQGIKPYAVIVNRLGYYPEDTIELPPIMKEFPRDLPNEADDERVLPDGTRIKSRKHDTAHQVIEVHVDEGVDTDKVVTVIQPAKFLKDEIV